VISFVDEEIADLASDIASLNCKMEVQR